MILKTTDTVNILARAWFTLKHCSPAWMMGLGPGCPRVFPPSEQGPPLLHICSFPVSLGSFLGMKCIPVAGLTSQLTTKYGCGFDLTPPPPGSPKLCPLQRTWAQRPRASAGFATRSLSLGLQLNPLPNRWRMAIQPGACATESCKPHLVPLESHHALEKPFRGLVYELEVIQ